MDCQDVTALQTMELFNTIREQRSKLVAENDDEKNADLVAEMTAAMRVIVKKIVGFVQGKKSATAPQSDPSLSVETTGLSVATTKKKKEISPLPAQVREKESRLIETTAPSTATVQENNKPAIVDDSDPFRMISLPSTPFSGKESRLIEEAEPSVAAAQENNKPAVIDEFDPDREISLFRTPFPEILLDDSRSLVHYKLSPYVNGVLAWKDITCLTPLQEEMVELLVGQPKAWYIEQWVGPNNRKKVRRFVGAQEPTDLEEGETAVERVLKVKALQDVVCLAHVNSGKILAYLLPIYEHLLVGNKVVTELHRPRHPSEHNENIIRGPTKPALARPFALILVPTRELAIQVYQEMVDLSLATWIQPAVLYGGTSQKDQSSMLAQGCDILVGTPGRVRDILRGSYIEGVKVLSLDNLSHMIWDEADELLSKDFAEEVEAIMGTRLRADGLNHWFFSSQYEEEHITKAESLISGVYEYINFDLPEENAAMRYCLKKQTFIEAGGDQSERFDAFNSIFCCIPPARTLVLCQTHASVEWLHEAITSINIPSRFTHGACSQEKREDAAQVFNQGLVPILVSTMGIGARGLSFERVDYLIFWEIPESLEQYKWCLGRVVQLGNPAKVFVLFSKGVRPTEEFLQFNKAAFQMVVYGLEVLVS